MISFCSKCSGWLLTFAYEPEFCASRGVVIGRRVPILEWSFVLLLAAAVGWVIVN
jgi:hypothetical protein